MPKKEDKIPVALLIIDVINDFNFPEAELLLKTSAPIAEKIANLKKRAKKEEIPVIYVNDNFGQWQSDKQKLVEYCMEQDGGEFVKQLQPDDDDYFVIKPKHSGFFSTPLSTLLNDLDIQTLILCGVAGNICVLFTANDAYMRGFTIYTPSDCSASNIEEDNKRALLLMERTLDADISLSEELDLKAIIEEAKKSKQKNIY
ncbi:cysteine hydrolase family protein [Fictibacillus phosphorivorans]|uniref:cysteine hydrolase family protein n=1 Tax=Fictibacillus phosphorivorans TaxID=1221500 RepID=UPI002041BA54|nr:isochorismatase family cysteine hydrolase [Fictibacillus phosphorivorans]MCM3720281.1 cysteine hydrolase [Fictibacillus phosphorivorans]MCM3777971.1 cysteine hydrolase [Fictibacillus phosphorivorans]